MAHAQIIEGTIEEITRQLHLSYAGQKLRVFVEPDLETEDLAAALPDPPNTVRSQEHLLQLLRAGLESPVHEVTDDTFEQMRQEVRKRRAQPQP